MEVGHLLQTTEEIQGCKKNIYANSLELVEIISLAHWPVLLVKHFDTKQTFPIHSERVTSELNPKNKAKIKICQLKALKK